MRPALVFALVLLAAPPVARGQSDPSAARLRVAAESLLAERFPDGAARMEPRVLRGPALPEGPLRLAFPDDAVPRGHTSVDVLAADGAGWRSAGRATLYVAHFDSVAVARRPLARGEALGPDDLAAAWAETTRLRADPVRWTDARALADGASARRALAAGETLRAGDLQAPPAVETGAAVEVRYQRNGLALTLRGQARERGALGEAVRVYCPDTRTTYRVRLVAPGVADWIETL